MKEEPKQLLHQGLWCVRKGFTTKFPRHIAPTVLRDILSSLSLTFVVLVAEVRLTVVPEATQAHCKNSYTEVSLLELATSVKASPLLGRHLLCKELYFLTTRQQARYTSGRKSCSWLRILCLRMSFAKTQAAGETFCKNTGGDYYSFRNC